MRDRALTLGAGLSVDRVVSLSEQVYDDRLDERLWGDTVTATRSTTFPSSAWSVARERGWPVHDFRPAMRPVGNQRAIV
jgi:hypothetical protein